jgi:hypothetical protein
VHLYRRERKIADATESFGKKAVDGLLRNPYLSSKHTALDVTITCPACPTYVTPAAATYNTRCTDEVEAAKHSKYDRLATDTGVLFSVAAFTTYGGWGLGAGIHNT